MKLIAAYLLLVAMLSVGVVQTQNAVVVSSNEGSYSPKHGDHPYHVHIRIARNNGNMMTCAGALIHPTWVATAARCIHDRASGIHSTFMWLLFGVINLSRPELVLEASFGQGVLHPQFNGIFHDFGLINTRYIHSTENYRPIRYQKQTVNFPLGEPFKTCFWGLNTNRTGPSQELRCADMSSVPLIPRCPAPPPFPFPDLICAFGPANCNSEIGTPLIMEEEDGLTLIGVFYYGPGLSCPSIEPDEHIAIGYTRVSLYADWISSVINPLNIAEQNNS